MEQYAILLVLIILTIGLVILILPTHDPLVVMKPIATDRNLQIVEFSSEKALAFNQDFKMTTYSASSEIPTHLSHHVIRSEIRYCGRPYQLLRIRSLDHSGEVGPFVLLHKENFGLCLSNGPVIVDCSDGIYPVKPTSCYMDSPVTFRQIG